MKYWLILFITIVCTAFNSNDGIKKKESITFRILIDQIKTSKGQIVVAAYTHKDQYTDHPKFHFVFPKSEVLNGKLNCTISDLPAGEYVFTILDDENNNNQMDYNWARLPKEGYGFSNNQKPSITGAPNFESCKVTVTKNTQLKMNMQYW